MKTVRKYTVRILKILGWTVAGIVTAAVILLCAVTLWLTPDNLTELVNREASERLNADVRTYNVRFTFWSTFPHLKIRMDSVSVVSRNLREIPAPLRRRLPDNPDFLAFASGLRGGINIARLVQGRITLHDVEVDSVRLNLVAVSDSLNNYDIVRDTTASEIPYFTTNQLRLRHGGEIAFFSLPSKADAVVSLDTLDVTRTDRKDDYRVSILGRLRLTGDGIPLLPHFPFGLQGRVHIGFHPFKMSAENYNVQLGNVSGKIDIDLDMENDLKINNFNYRINGLDLKDIFSFLPGLHPPLLSRLDMDLYINASARLLSPYSPSSAWLPSVELDFSTRDGNVTYRLDNGSRINMSRIFMSGNFIYDGRHPDKSRLDIPRFSSTVAGMDIEAGINVTDIPRDPFVAATVKADADLRNLSALAKLPADFSLTGRCGARGAVSFRTSELEARKLEAVDAETEIDVPAATLSQKSSGIKVAASRLRIRGRMQAGNVDSRISGGQFNVKSGDAECTASGISGHARIPLGRDGENIDNLGCLLSAGNVKLSGTKAAGKAARTLNLAGISMEFGSARRRNVIPGDTASDDAPLPAAWTADDARLAQVGHTPQFITAAGLPDALRTLMRRWDASLNLRIDRGNGRIPAFPSEINFAGISISSNLDTLSVRGRRLTSDNTSLSFSAASHGLRHFLLSRRPVPLHATLNLAIDTAHLNSLSRIYERGQMDMIGKNRFMATLQKRFVGADTLALLLPRNLRAQINATARETRYINLRLYNLATGIRIRDGRADIDSLNIESDFGKLSLGFTYDSSNVDSLAMKLNAGIRDVEVVSFFDNFHQLLEMMPYMINLKGTLSANVSGCMTAFPDMYIDVPSILASAEVRGVGITVHQTRFIRHITKMLLIPESGDIHIKNILARALVRDNLLILQPFDFTFSNYSLRMEGMNNFNGDLAYHVGLLKSPFHLPFGVNIQGQFRNPKLRFGGVHWNDRRASEVASSMEGAERINLLSELKYYLRRFVHTGASYYPGKYE